MLCGGLSAVPTKGLDATSIYAGLNTCSSVAYQQFVNLPPSHRKTMGVNILDDRWKDLVCRYFCTKDQKFGKQGT